MMNIEKYKPFSKAFKVKLAPWYLCKKHSCTQAEFVWEALQIAKVLLGCGSTFASRTNKEVLLSIRRK
jgi:hypothetical protein